MKFGKQSIECKSPAKDCSLIFSLSPRDAKLEKAQDSWDLPEKRGWWANIARYFFSLELIFSYGNLEWTNEALHRPLE